MRGIRSLFFTIPHSDVNNKDLALVNGLGLPRRKTGGLTHHPLGRLARHPYDGFYPNFTFSIT